MQQEHSILVIGGFVVEQGKRPIFSCNRFEHKSRDLAIIEAQQSEVRLDSDRETDGDGQGSGLSGEAESQFAGLRFARPAADQ